MLQMYSNLILSFCLALSCIFVQGGVPYGCRINEFTVTLLRNGTGDNAAEVLQHLRDGNLTLVDPRVYPWYCIDGRTETAVLGTPGGDAGEFLLALQVHSRNGGNVTTEEQVSKLFFGFVETLPSGRGFYMHTDNHAVDNLEATLHERLNETGQQHANLSDIHITKVPLELQDEFRDLILEPGNIGCGHMRLITQHPDQYQIPTNLSFHLIRVFHDYMWNTENQTAAVKKQPANYVVNTGDHAEQAIVNVITRVLVNAEQCSNYIPLLVPRNSHGSVFINHISHVGILRDQLAAYFATQPGAISKQEIRKQVDDLAAIQLGLTVSYLAPASHVYELAVGIDTNDVYDSSTGVYDSSAPFQFMGLSTLLLLLSSMHL